MTRSLATRCVVVTGASAGVGRAVARTFGEHGARVGLLARGEAGLKGAALDVEHAGGEALTVTADVANPQQVNMAAEAVERNLGPIDIWVNNAMTTVFAPVWEIDPEEYERVTDVTYLGGVHGTMAALAVMRPRDEGKIIQVGSALSYRAIPYQSAYCGAKYALRGFTDALRAELLHEDSGIDLTMVHLPAINSPQFGWSRSKLPRHPQPMPPIFQPEVAARAVCWAAGHDRREVWVGGSSVGTIAGAKLAPAALDHYLGRPGWDAQQTGDPLDPDRADNLFEPVDDDEDRGAHGPFDDDAKHRSRQLTVSLRRGRAATAVGALITGLAGLWNLRRRRR